MKEYRSIKDKKKYNRRWKTRIQLDGLQGVVKNETRMWEENEELMEKRNNVLLHMTKDE